MNDAGKKWLLPISLLLFVVSAILAFLLPETPAAWIAACSVAGILLVASVVSHAKELSVLMSRRTSRYGMVSAFTIVLAVAVTIVSNLIANNYDVRKDLTKGQTQSLSEQTVQVLKGLTSEVRVKAFLNPSRPEFKRGYQEYFEKFLAVTPKLKVDYIDWDREFGAVAAYQLTKEQLQTGTLIFEAASGRNERVENVGLPEEDNFMESKLTNALIKVTRKVTKKKAYFLLGHGEKGIQDDRKGPGLSLFTQRLNEMGMLTAPLVLAETRKIPEDTEILVIAGPRTGFASDELKMIEAYQVAGGKMLVLLDPESPDSLQPLLAKNGIEWAPGKAAAEGGEENEKRRTTGLAPIVRSFNQGHPVTKNNGAGFLTLFVVATPVTAAAKPPEGFKSEGLLFTSAKSAQITYPKGAVAEKPGPLSLGVAVSAPVKTAAPAKPKDAAKPGEKPAMVPEENLPKKEMRLVVIGDSDFVVGGNLALYSNADFVLNAMSWLAEEEDVIAVRPRAKDDRQFNLTPFRAKIIAVTSLAGIPLIMLVSAFFVWRSRKRR